MGQLTSEYVNADPFVFTGDVLEPSYIPSSDRYPTCGADVKAFALVNTSGCRLPVGDGLAEHHFQSSRVGASNGDVLALPKLPSGSGVVRVRMPSMMGTRRQMTAVDYARARRARSK